MHFYGLHVGVKFSFPVAIIDLWNFVAPPSGEVPSPFSLVPITNVPSFAVYSIAFIFIQSALAAGYLGSLNEYVDEGEFHFTEHGGTYLFDFLLYYLLQWFLSLLGIFLVFLPFLVFLLIPILLFIGYLLYGIPFLIVTTDQGFSFCLKRSVHLAL